MGLNRLKAETFIKGMSLLSDHIRPHIDGLTRFLPRPNLSLVNQMPPDATPAIALINDEALDFRAPFDNQQFTREDLNPASDVAVFKLGDVYDAVIFLQNSLQTLPDHLGSCGITQLAAERSNTLGVCCARCSHSQQRSMSHFA